jgi:hypothetical protein
MALRHSRRLQSFAGSLDDLASASRNRAPVGLPTVGNRLAERILFPLLGQDRSLDSIRASAMFEDEQD